MHSRRFFIGVLAGAMFTATAKAERHLTIFYSDTEIVVIDGWVLRRDEAERWFRHVA